MVGEGDGGGGETEDKKMEQTQGWKRVEYWFVE